MTKTLKELELKHPEWCFVCGAYFTGSAEHQLYCVERRSWDDPMIAALIAAKREDEARIAELGAELDRVKTEVSHIVGNHSYRCGRYGDLTALVSICDGAKGEIGEDHETLAQLFTAEQAKSMELSNSATAERNACSSLRGEIGRISSQLTAEQQAHWETKRQLDSMTVTMRAIARMASVEDADMRHIIRETAQASINHSTDNSPTDDRGEGEK